MWKSVSWHFTRDKTRDILSAEGYELVSINFFFFHSHTRFMDTIQMIQNDFEIVHEEMF